MNDPSRRDFGWALAALAACAGTAESQSSGSSELATSQVFGYDQMPVKKQDNGGEGRAVMHGTLPTGEYVEVHETMLPAGEMPHPPHRHRHSEMLLIREGTLEVTGEAEPKRIGPGDVAYSASDVMHGLKNVGTTPAKYFVVAVGIQKPEATPVKS